jgi:hypothetical protein
MLTLTPAPLPQGEGFMLSLPQGEGFMLSLP